MKNAFQIIHIIGSMQGLFLFLILVMRKQNKLANKVLATLIFLLTIHLAAAFFHTNNSAINDLMAIGRSDMFVLFYGPLIAFYTLFLTGFREELKARYFCHLIPAFILMLILLISNFSAGNPLLMSIWDEESHFVLKAWYMIHAASLVHLLFYLLFGLFILGKYKKRLSSYFSQSGRINLLWLQILLFSILSISLFAVVQFLLNTFHDPEGILQWMISGITVLLIFVMGYFTNTQPDILGDLKDMNRFLLTEEEVTGDPPEPQIKTQVPVEEKSSKYEKSRLCEEEERSILNKLLEYVEDEKPYLESELNLRQLSEGTGIPSHQISMLLSIYLKQNFYTFINKYRVEEAKKRLAADDSMEHNILTIAYDTGFNSKSTFNTVFKKFEGVTPSEFRAQFTQKNSDSN